MAFALTLAVATSAAAAASVPTRVKAISRALAFTVVIDGSDDYGAGILVDPRQGLVLTNLHVVEDMQAPRVSFSDGAQFDGRIVEVDRTLDLALLEIPPQKRPAPVFGDDIHLEPGDEIYAIGNPRLLGFSVARGIVSYPERTLEGQKYLQTDLPINEGNSGGPVLNARGELVGIMSFVLKNAQGLSFALPVRYATQRFTRLHR